jgi:hypothetical protein
LAAIWFSSKIAGFRCKHRSVSPLLPGKVVSLLVATFAFGCRAQRGACASGTLGPPRSLRRFLRRPVLRNVRKVRKVLTARALELV